MTTRKKILGGLIFVFIFGLILGLTGMVSISRLTALSDEQYQLQQAGTSISAVLNAHNSWKQQLTETVLLGTEFKGSFNPDSCAFGKWKNTEEAKSITDPAVLKLLTEIEEPHSYIHIRAKDIVALVSAGNMDEAGLLLAQDIFPQLDKTVSLLTEVENSYNVLMETKGTEIVQYGKRMTSITIALLAISVVACVLFAWKITASIMKPIRKITQAAQAISTGDLDVMVEYAVNDEIGELARAFQDIVEGTLKQMSVSEALADGNLTVEIIPRSEKDMMGFSLKKTADNLDSMLKEIATSTIHVSNGAKQMAASSQTLAQGSAEQASVVQQLSASINEIAEKTSQNANMAKEAAELSAVVKSNTEKGGRQMESMMQAVQEINDASVSIRKVIKVIDDIAFQTNILALNAAVEAARAGQHGKGFAVVAEEVRNLAQKSAAAAKDTGGLIEDSIERAHLGLSIAAETSNSLKEIIDNINRSTEIVAQIALSSDEQVGAITQINSGIEQVEQVVQQNSATAEESAATSGEMSNQAELLQDFVSQFKLRNSNNAIDAPAFSPALLQQRPDILCLPSQPTDQ